MTDTTKLLAMADRFDWRAKQLYMIDKERAELCRSDAAELRAIALEPLTGKQINDAGISRDLADLIERALAQPAEAVEDLENAAWTCPNGHSWQEWPKHLGCPDCATHDAAQGAVAWHAEKTGRSSWSGNTKTSVGVSIEYPQSAADEGYTVRPLIFGDTHPQAAPAQEDGWKSPFGPCVCNGANQCPGCNPNAAIELAREIATDDERRKHPPCLDCGAVSQEDAQGKCRCGGDNDDCHGCYLWPDDTLAAAPSQEGES